jgi:DNA-binding NarL/FixJ family response regulator
VNVLVVEDEEDIRFLLRCWLAEDPRCSQVVEADGPTTAVLECARHPLDVILVAFKIGGGTATDCLPRLRSEHPDARIIVYTASLLVAHQANVLALGADLVVEQIRVVEDVVDLVLSDAGGPSRP